MSDQSDNYFDPKSLGLSDEEGRLYLFLINNGFSTALVMSRQLHIARTKIYRLLDRLIQKRLVEQKLEDRGMRFGPKDPKALADIISEKEYELTSLKNTLPDIISHLQQLMGANTKQSKVLYYSGMEGLQQINYNLLRAKDMLRVYEVEHLSDYLPKRVADDIRQKLVDQKVMTRDLTNQTTLTDFTDVTDMIKYYSEIHYIPKNQLSIDFEVMIYNDVYVIDTFKGNEIFCVEIYNEQLATMQKQIFDFIWEKATPLTFTSTHGAARIKK